MYTLIAAYLILNAFLLGRIWEELNSRKQSDLGWLSYHAKMALVLVIALCFLSLIFFFLGIYEANKSIEISKTHILIN